MRKGIMFIGLAIFLVLASHACGGHEMVITKKENNREITVKSNDIIKVELASQGGTGFIWGFNVLDPEFLEILKDETRSESGTGMTGGPVIHIWTIRAKKPGTTEMNMNYYRSWEGKDKAADTFTVKIIILP